MDSSVAPSSSSTNSSSSASSSVYTDTINFSQTPSLILNRPPLYPIPINPSLNTTPTHTSQTQTPIQTPQTTPIALQTRKTLTVPFSDTELPLDPFDITPTHSPPPSFRHIPDPSDIGPILLDNFIKPHTSKKPLFNFLNIAPNLNLDFLFPLLSFKIPVLEPIETLSEKFSLTLILLPFSSIFAISSPSPSLASTNSFLQRHQAQYRSSDSLSSNNNILTSGVDVAFSQRSSLSSFIHTGHLFSRPTYQTPMFSLQILISSIWTSPLINTLLPLHLIVLTILFL